MAGDVIPFPPIPPAVHVACSCGSEWWHPLGVVIDAATEHVTGYAYPLACVECGETRGPAGAATVTALSRDDEIHRLIKELDQARSRIDDLVSRGARMREAMVGLASDLDDDGDHGTARLIRARLRAALAGRPRPTS